MKANGFTFPITILVGDRLIIPAPGTSPDPGTYMVLPGDTLDGIAARFGVTLEALVEANGFTYPITILAGDTLIIPKP